jgi:hypothetical protein
MIWPIWPAVKNIYSFDGHWYPPLLRIEGKLNWRNQNWSGEAYADEVEIL